MKSRALYFSALFVLLVTVIYWFQPDRTGELIDTDEPLTAIRALLYHQGFSLHEQVWSDQPPLLSVIFSWTLYFCDPSLEAGRFLVVLSGAVLGTSLAFIVYTQRGITASVICALLLLASGRFLRLSGALMVGLPALSFATLSLALLFASRGRNLLLLFLSGAAFALGIATKLFVILLVPAAGTYFVIQAWGDYKQDKSLRAILAPGAIWGSATLVVVALLAWFFAPALYAGYASQLFEGHEKLRHGFQGDQLPMLIDLAQEDLYIFALAALGVCFCCINARRECLVPAVWFCVAVQFLRTHHPVWIHHYLLYSIPAVWLAALAVSELFLGSDWNVEQRAKGAWTGRLAAFRTYVLVPLLCVTTIWAVISIPARLASKKENLAKIRIGINDNLLRRIGELKPSITWMVSDSPVYAFLNNVRVVPELGLIPRKRLDSGELSVDQIYDLIKRYSPEVVLVHRFPELRSRLFPLLKDSYTADHKFKQLLIRRDVSQPGS